MPLSCATLLSNSAHILVVVASKLYSPLLLLDVIKLH